MIVIKVELWSAITGSKQELARMVIDNVGGDVNRGDYRTRTLRGRDEGALDRAMRSTPMGSTREGFVEGHPRLREHVWNLVAKALASMKYGEKR